MIAVSLIVGALLSAVSPAHPFAADSASLHDRAQQAAGMGQESQPVQPGKFDPSRFDSVTAGALRVLLDTAAAHKIPTAYLVNKAYEGAARRASTTKILTNVHDTYVAMLDARAALGENSTESELSSGADALRMGADGKALQAIRATRPASGSAVGAIVVFVDIARRGISMNDARDAVLTLAKTYRTDESLNGLQSLVARNSERGPGMAQDAMKRYIKDNVAGAQKNGTAKPVTPRPPSPPDAS
ncbi:MAG: hypothetical protein ABI852_03340 [Gemmatimonadaceae bacterium]